MNGRGRPRGPGPLPDQPPLREPRRAAESRNGGQLTSGDAALWRERFEDDKRRIMESCFSKKDADGVLVESYITHVRVTEDAAYPSTPPPPNSPPENKKARVIVVAVRKSGKVRVHKARENSDGSFSIGKTWMLDDLSAIQSYAAWTATTPEEQQQKEWASNVGFVVTIGKPYYWTAVGGREKEFFIGSLVKIYKKYTTGNVPNLIGFTDRERQLLAGLPTQTAPGAPSSRASPTGARYPDGALNAPRPGPMPSNRPQSPYSNRASSRDGQGDIRIPHSDEVPLRAQRSRDQMRRPSGGQSGKVQAPPVGLSTTSSSEPRDQPPPRASERIAVDGMPNSLSVRAARPSSRDSPIPDVDELHLGRSQDELQSLSSRNGMIMSEQERALSQDSRASSPEAKRIKEGLPPNTPVSASINSEQSRIDGTIERTPVTESKYYYPDGDPSNGFVQADVPPSVRTGSFTSNRAPSLIEKGEPGTAQEVAVSSTAEGTETLETAAETSASPTVSQDIASSESGGLPEKLALSLDTRGEEQTAHRPGLGPMVKKRSVKDIAGAFRKAANAYGAFRPRPGGAGERLLAAAKKAQAKPDEPDGISGVVPAPSLRPAADDSPSLALQNPTQETPPAISLPQPTPTVEITLPASKPTIDVTTPADEQINDALEEATPAQNKLPSPSSPERPRKRREDNTAKYSEALGIDPGVLEAHGVEFDDILTELGWNGRLSHDRRIEDLEADIRREIGRVEATTWLGNLELQDGRVDQLARLIDKTIEECEELDSLLTLYSHELNTLRDDVAYIEAQSQGLQVQTANQKLLYNEVRNLLNTQSISSSDLQPLREASLSSPDGLK